MSGIFLLDSVLLQRKKQALSHVSTLRAALQQLLLQADALLTSKPGSVVEKVQLPASGDKHDYLSLAPYFWPDPSTSDGLPYIRRDGRVNPEINTISDKANLNRMMSSVKTLALAYYFSDKDIYAEKAADFLRIWFLNQETYMKPSLNHAQMIRGINTGRPIGIIETRGFANVVDAIGLIQGSPSWKVQDQQGMETWFRQYLEWLMSPAARDEAEASNNHGCWYDVQATSIALFVGQEDWAKHVLEASKTKRIQGQILADGSQPLELQRTRSWHYSVFNLQALFSLASIGEQQEINLWDYQNAQGAGLQKALDYVLPAAIKEKVWPHQLIDTIRSTDLLPLLYQAATHYHEPAYLQAADAIAVQDTSTTIDHLLYETNPDNH
jgi:hypothetical protein